MIIDSDDDSVEKSFDSSVRKYLNSRSTTSSSSIQIFFDRFLDIVTLVGEIRDSSLCRSDLSHSDLSLFSRILVRLYLSDLSLSDLFFFLLISTDWLTYCLSD